jgi:hypothetical protein
MFNRRRQYIKFRQYKPCPVRPQVRWLQFRKLPRPRWLRRQGSIETVVSSMDGRFLSFLHLPDLQPAV